MIKTKIITSLLVLLLNNTSFSQTFSQLKFEYKGVCTLENAVNTTDENGNKVSVFQCVNQSSSITIYRVNAISFKALISDTDEYFKSLKREYANLGTPTSTSLKGKQAIQLVEDVTVEGHSMMQISVSTLYKNRAITLVLVTNSSDYTSLLNSFKNNFSFL